MLPTLRPTLTLALAGLLAASTAFAAKPKPVLLPRPTGTWAVGTTVVYLTDSSRTAGPPGATFPRPITVQLWYPAANSSSSAAPATSGSSAATGDSTAAPAPARDTATTAPYLVEPGLADVLASSGYYGVDSTSLRGWGSLATAARTDAPIASGKNRIVTLSHGLGMLRANYTALAIELASRGIVVAAIDHPYGGLCLVPPRLVLSAGDDSTNWDDLATHAKRMDEWADDIGFVIDWLSGPSTQGTAAAVARMVDWRKIGTLGHSSGGLAAVQAASRIQKIRVAVDMDGGLTSPDGQPLAGFVRSGVVRPTLFLKSQPIYSDADLKKRGRTRKQYDDMAKVAGAAFDSLPKSLNIPVLVASVAGTGHLSFSDAPFVMPETITQFGGTIIEPKRGLEVTAGVLMAFFDQYLHVGRIRPQAISAVQTATSTSPEVTVREAGRTR